MAAVVTETVVEHTAEGQAATRAAAAVAAVDAVVARERAAAMEGRTQRGTVKHRHAATSEAYALPPCLGGTGTCSPRRSQS